LDNTLNCDRPPRPPHESAVWRVIVSRRGGHLLTGIPPQSTHHDLADCSLRPLLPTRPSPAGHTIPIAKPKCGSVHLNRMRCAVTRSRNANR
jgi:hypothetical protein